MKSMLGLTLLEVVVAGGLLTVGVLAVGSFQLQALQVQRRLQVTRELVQVAEAELDLQLALTSPSAGECRVDPDLYSFVSLCRVETGPCGADCGYGGGLRGELVRVEVEADDGQEFELEALTARFPP